MRRRVIVDFIRAVGAVLVLGGLVVGIPVLLVTLVGSPLPHSVPSLDNLSRGLAGRSISDQFLLKAIAVVCWLAWIEVVLCTVVEVVAWLRGHVGLHVPLAGGLQAVVRQLVVTATLLIGPHLRPASAEQLVLRPTPAAAFVRPPAIADRVEANGSFQATEATPTSTSQKVYVVQPRDDLWSLAETHLGDPLRWRDVFDLNQDRPQPDRGVLRDPDLIRPGWTLRFPDDATGIEVAPTNPTPEPAAELTDAPAAALPPPPVAPTLSAPVCPAPAPSTPASVPSAATTAPPPSTPPTQGSVASPETTPPVSPTAGSAARPPTAGWESSASTASTLRSNGSQDADAGAQLPVPIGVLGAGLLAAGTLATLNRLRRAQSRRRKSGRSIRLPAESLRSTETAIRMASDEPGASRVDQALRALASCLSQARTIAAPVVQAVQVDGDRVEILFSEPVKAPAGPFSVTAGGRSWVLDPGVATRSLGSLVKDRPAPTPTLVEVGHADNATVLIDLEAAGCTAISGEPDRCEALCRSWALELATSLWSDHIDIVSVGPIASRLHGLERINAVDSLDDVVDDIVAEAQAVSEALAAEKAPSTLAARVTSPDGWAPKVILCDPAGASPESMEQLLAAAGDGGRGLAVVLLGDVPKADRSVRVFAESVVVEPPGLSLAPLELSLEDVCDIESVIAVAADATEENDEGVWQQPERDVASRAGPATLVSVGEFGDVEVEVASPSPLRGSEVEVNVLGTVEIDGGKDRIERRKSIELVVYLALHPKGVDYGRLKAALWPDRIPSQGVFNTTMSLARSRLGQATDGSLHLLHVSDGVYQVGAGVVTDFGRFESLVQQAKGDGGAQAVDQLTKALDLVRGLPFEGTRSGYEWAHAEGMIAQMEAVVADAAHLLAELSIQDNNPALAQWAAMQGLKASPGDEVLYRDRMRASDLVGNPGSVEAVMDELCQVAEALEPYDTLHPETIALYEQLSHRRRRTGDRVLASAAGDR